MFRRFPIQICERGGPVCTGSSKAGRIANGHLKKQILIADKGVVKGMPDEIGVVKDDMADEGKRIETEQIGIQ